MRDLAVRLDRLFRVAALTSIVLVSQPAPASADHCGADATVSPLSGPPGTTFVFRTNLGAPSELEVFRNERLVKVVSLEGNGFVRYRIRTGPGDAGTWRAHAAVVGRPDCVAEASFSVVGPPDTATVASPRAPLAEGGAAPWIAGAGAAAFLLVIGRPRIRRAVGGDR
jgi:hypothetical protein